VSKLLSKSGLLPSLLVAVALVAPNRSLAQDSPSEAGGAKAMAVVAISSYDELIGDVKFIGKLIDRPDIGDMVTGGIALFTQGKGLDGLDKTKPWGVIVQASDADIVPMGFLPVSDLKKLLAVLAPIAGEATEGDDGVYEMEAGLQSVYLKSVGGWAFIANDSDALKNVPADPTAAFAGLDKEYDIAVRLNVQNIPQMYRQMAIEQIKQGVELGLDRGPDESEEDYNTRKALIKNQMKQIVSFIDETQHLTMGWAIDATAEKTYFDISMAAVPGTKLAKQAAQFANAKTKFGGFLSDGAAVKMNLTTKGGSPEDIAQSVAAIKMLREQAMKAIDEESELPEGQAREIVKSAMGDVMDVLTATIEGGSFDMGGMVQLEPGKLTVAMGGLVADGAKMESALKKLENLAKEEEGFKGVQWNADEHDGVKFHTLQVPMDDEDAQKLLGDQLDVVIGTSDNTFLVAFGKDAMATLKGVLDKSKADADKTVPPMQVAISVGKIAAFIAAQEDDPTAAMIAEMLSKSGGKDHVNLTITGIPNGFVYRIEAQEGVLKAIGAAAK
jgi:hypothetical protein